LDVVGGVSTWFKHEGENGLPEPRIKGKNIANNIEN
jgi:hypothetical protein